MTPQRIALWRQHLTPVGWMKGTHQTDYGFGSPLMPADLLLTLTHEEYANDKPKRTYHLHTDDLEGLEALLKKYPALIDGSDAPSLREVLTQFSRGDR